MLRKMTAQSGLSEVQDETGGGARAVNVKSPHLNRPRDDRRRT